VSSREAQKEEARRQRIAAEQEAKRGAARKQRLQTAGIVAALAVIAAVCIVLIANKGGSSSSGSGAPAGSATLAPLGGEATGQTVDGIQCQAAEQVLFHIHAHLAVFVDGSQRAIPAGIGIPAPRVTEQTSTGPFIAGGRCYYWLHSHTADGVIHIESPVKRTYTLGNYFDLWKQPLSANQVGPAKGPVTAYRDGKRYTGDPRTIPLAAHTLIQLDVGKDVGPQGFSFPSGL